MTESFALPPLTRERPHDKVSQHQKKPALDYCDPKITSIVEDAYDAVWAIVQNANPSNGAKTECERKGGA